MRKKDFMVEYYNDENNEFDNRKINDTRKNRVTLKHLNRLRKQREIYNIENAIRIKNIKNIYSESK